MGALWSYACTHIPNKQWEPVGETNWVSRAHDKSGSMPAFTDDISWIIPYLSIFVFPEEKREGAHFSNTLL